jgi:hypothetical protein
MKGRILYLTVVDFSSVASRAKSEILRTGGLDIKLVKASYKCKGMNVEPARWEEGDSSA